jgi:hypothetical protein
MVPLHPIHTILGERLVNFFRAFGITLDIGGV